jgi:hypothetical protein
MAARPAALNGNNLADRDSWGCELRVSAVFFSGRSSDWKEFRRNSYNWYQ